jgi:electron transfer flavoprotein-quinone oxidoreductase
MIDEFDVVIVGAGPAGISAAYILAGQGIKTIVFERGEYPGAKNISGGVLYGHDLSRIIPDFMERACPVERNIVESRLWYLSKEAGYSIAFRDKAFYDRLSLNAFTVGRARFDRWFAGQAGKNGALVVCSTVVTDLLRDGNNRVIGVRTDRPEGDVKARVVLLADGINSALAAKTGFRPEPKPRDVALAVKDVIEVPEDMINERFGLETGQGVTTEIIGEITGGMDGIAVIYTNKNSLSLCIGANLSDFTKNKVKPYELLEEFKNHPMVSPLIKGGQPKEYMAHWIAEGGYDAIPELCGNGYIIAGDSGMLFNALHREGSNMAMASGRFAAEAIMDALDRGDFSRNVLMGYVSRLNESYIIQDLKKYRRFNSFRLNHHELFTTLPGLTALAAREMLTVDGVPKKERQRAIWKKVRKETSLSKLVRIIWDGWRSVK